MDPATHTDVSDSKFEDLASQIADLEARLASARQKLQSQQTSTPSTTTTTTTTPPYTITTQPQHTLLLLSDSALPLGSFAFSSGLESFLQHVVPTLRHQRRPLTNPSTSTSTSTIPIPIQEPFSKFLPLSLSSHAGATLPFVLSAYRSPHLLIDLDDAFDATIMCTVGRRASVAQGRALLALWEKAFVHGIIVPDYNDNKTNTTTNTNTNNDNDDDEDIPGILKAYSIATKQQPPPPSPSLSSSLPTISTHLPPLFGVVCKACGFSAEQTAYSYLLSHAKALLSAAVRAGVFGPYHAQKILASAELVRIINAVVAREWHVSWFDAAQYVPMLDLWTGRHDLLYSRIFNS